MESSCREKQDADLKRMKSIYDDRVAPSFRKAQQRVLEMKHRLVELEAAMDGNLDHDEVCRSVDALQASVTLDIVDNMRRSIENMMQLAQQIKSAPKEAKESNMIDLTKEDIAETTAMSATIEADRVPASPASQTSEVSNSLKAVEEEGEGNAAGKGASLNTEKEKFGKELNHHKTEHELRKKQSDKEPKPTDNLVDDGDVACTSDETMETAEAATPEIAATTMGGAVEGRNESSLDEFKMADFESEQDPPLFVVDNEESKKKSSSDDTGSDSGLPRRRQLISMPLPPSKRLRSPSPLENVSSTLKLEELPSKEDLNEALDKIVASIEKQATSFPADEMEKLKAKQESLEVVSEVLDRLMVKQTESNPTIALLERRTRALGIPMDVMQKFLDCSSTSELDVEQMRRLSTRWRNWLETSHRPSFSMGARSLRIEHSTGIPRSAMNDALYKKHGIFAMFSQSAFATKDRKLSHIVLNNRWNNFVQSRDECQKIYVGTGSIRQKQARILEETTNSFPLFSDPKDTNDTCIFYVGHWKLVPEAVIWFDPPHVFMGEQRCMYAELMFDSFDEELAESIAISNCQGVGV